MEGARRKNGWEQTNYDLYDWTNKREETNWTIPQEVHKDLVLITDGTGGRQTGFTLVARRRSSNMRLLIFYLYQLLICVHICIRKFVIGAHWNSHNCFETFANCCRNYCLIHSKYRSITSNFITPIRIGIFDSILHVYQDAEVFSSESTYQRRCI